MTNPPGLNSVKAKRRNTLRFLFASYGQTVLAERTGVAGPYLWQMAYGEGKSARGISDAMAEKIEKGLGLDRGALGRDEEDAPNVAETKATYMSQPVQLNSERIQASIRFLESQFGLWDKEFILTDQWDLVARVYDKLSLPAPPNRIELSQWLADQIMGDDNERERKVASAGQHDRSGNEGRAPKAKAASGRTK